MKALVVDDSKAMRLIIRRALEAKGLKVVEADNGRTALEMLQAQRDIALAMVDHNMAEMNGITLVGEIRKDSAFDDLKIVMVTSETEAKMVSRALELGANEYVMKPFTPDTIAGKLELLGLV